MSQSPSVAIVANPYSGGRGNRLRVEALVRELAARGLAPEMIWGRAGDRLADGTPYRCVVAAGGDGTVAGVINARLDLPLAVLPLGTENLFAKALGYSASPDRLARAIAAGRVRRIDLARAGDTRFSLMVSAGFDAEVTHRLARWRRRKAGLKRVRHLNYGPHVLGALREYDYPTIELEADGVRVRGAQVFVFNLPAYALQLPLAPDARPDDGLLDWVVLERPGWPAMMGYLWSVFGRALRRRPDVRCGRARRVRLTGASGTVPIQADGDALGYTPLEIAVEPRALQALAP